MRTAIANAVEADLFVSIHLNASAQDAEEQGGLATFVLDTTDDQAALRLAARENGTDIEGVSKLQFILASLRLQGGNFSKSAKNLGVHRNTLRNKITNLGMSESDFAEARPSKRRRRARVARP